MDFVIGTAGHIDHGKTALVRALTGVDADRLPEEKRRGITIDLGFAELDLGDGVRLGFVDVPGHERFVKNMLAGAHGIDLVALVIAADEGVMPQTREHFDICRLLEIKTGIVILTKTDLVEAELLELVRLETAELVQNSFLENAPVVAVSAKTGGGIAELKTILKNVAQTIPARKNESVTRLPIDRAFSVKGFGAVVTGTLVAGEIAEGAEMELLPANDSPGKKVRVRGVQTHGTTVSAARAGQRAAVNLGGIDYLEIKRGMILAPPNSLRPTQIFDAQVEVLKTAPRVIKSRQRVRVHIGTVEVLARVQVLGETNEIPAGEKGFVQLRLETSIVAVPNERFIIRSYSPQQTIAGGAILDGLAAKHRRRDFASTRERLEKWLTADAQSDKQTQLRLFLETADERGLTLNDLQARTGWRKQILENVLAEVTAKKSVIRAEEFFLTRTAFENLIQKTLLEIETHHRREPLSRGIGRETLREKIFAHLPSEIFRQVLGQLEKQNQIAPEKNVVRAASYNQSLSVPDQQLLDKIVQIYALAKLEVPNLENALAAAVVGTRTTAEHARKIFQLLIERGEIVRVTPEFYFRREDLTALIGKIRASADHDRTIDVAQFKDLAGISRKYAIPLLEYFDREKVTRRMGDKRLIL